MVLNMVREVWGRVFADMVATTSPVSPVPLDSLFEARSITISAVFYPGGARTSLSLA